MSHVTMNLECGKQVVGNKWWETGHTHKPQAHEGHAMKCKKLNTQDKGQRAAHDIYVQVLLWGMHTLGQML